MPFDRNFRLAIFERAGYHARSKGSIDSASVSNGISWQR
jgi:hypothetical protein